MITLENIVLACIMLAVLALILALTAFAVVWLITNTISLITSYKKQQVKNKINDKAKEAL